MWERPHISGEPVVAMDSIPGPPDQSQWAVHRLTQSVLEKIPFERDKYSLLPEEHPLDLGHDFMNRLTVISHLSCTVKEDKI